jgi:1,4-alpha-glucan branching enzyme
MSKYHAVPTVIDGKRFASKAEANRYLELKLLAQAGEITDLVTQPKFIIWECGKEKITYVGDFSYRENYRHVVEDIKGIETPVFRIKAKMFRAVYPEIDFRIIKC